MKIFSNEDKTGRFRPNVLMFRLLSIVKQKVFSIFLKNIFIEAAYTKKKIIF